MWGPGLPGPRVRVTNFFDGKTSTKLWQLWESCGTAQSIIVILCYLWILRSFPCFRELQHWMLWGITGKRKQFEPQRVSLRLSGSCIFLAALQSWCIMQHLQGSCEAPWHTNLKPHKMLKTSTLSTLPTTLAWHCMDSGESLKIWMRPLGRWGETPKGNPSWPRHELQIEMSYDLHIVVLFGNLLLCSSYPVVQDWPWVWKKAKRMEETN